MLPHLGDEAPQPIEGFHVSTRVEDGVEEVEGFGGRFYVDGS